MSGYIPKEQLDAYRRWQIESFDEPKLTAPEPIPEVVTSPPEEGEVVTDFGLPTAEDIERIHAEAQQEGYRAGFDEGREAGYQEGLEAARTAAEKVALTLDNFQRSLAELDQSVAEQILELGLEVARQVLQSTIQAQPEIVLPIIREALAALPIHHGHVTLHLNPADAPLVREHLGEQFAQVGTHIIENREIDPGGCLVRAGSSEVDASVATRWRHVLEAIGAKPTPWLEES